MSETPSSIYQPDPKPAIPQRRSLSLTERFARTPVTLGMIAFTALVFLSQSISEQLAGIDLVLVYGAKVNQAISAGEIWRIVTPIFIHLGGLHFLVNMYSLFVLGPAVERLFSSPRMLSIYLLSGISGVVFSMAFSPQPSVGASGAIFGLLGALGAFLYRHRNRFGRAGQFQLRQIVIIIVLNLGLGLSQQIDNWGHLGGLMMGILLTSLAGPQLERVEDQPQLIDRRPWEKAWPKTVLLAGIVAILAFAATFSPVQRAVATTNDKYALACKIP